MAGTEYVVGALFSACCACAALWGGGEWLFLVSFCGIALPLGLFLVRSERFAPERVFPILALAWFVARFAVAGGGAPDSAAGVETALIAGAGFLYGERRFQRGVFLCVGAAALLYGASNSHPSYPFFLIAAFLAGGAWLSAVEMEKFRSRRAFRAAKRAFGVSLAWQTAVAAVCAVVLGIWFVEAAGRVASVVPRGGTADEAVRAVAVSPPEAGVHGRLLEWFAVSAETLWRTAVDIFFNPWGAVAAVCAGLALSAWVARRRISRVLEAFAAKRRAERDLRVAKLKADEGDAAGCVRLCYRAARTFLEAAGFPREGNLELFDYAASLEKLDGEVRKDAMVVFLIHTKLVYGTVGALRKDCDEALKRAASVGKAVGN